MAKRKKKISKSARSAENKAQQKKFFMITLLITMILIALMYMINR